VVFRAGLDFYRKTQDAGENVRLVKQATASTVQTESSKFLMMATVMMMMMIMVLRTWTTVILIIIIIIIIIMSNNNQNHCKLKNTFRYTNILEFIQLIHVKFPQHNFLDPCHDSGI
jgi:TctA family transporter